MIDTDLVVLAPWVVFAGAVATIVVIVMVRGRREGPSARRRRQRPSRGRSGRK